jgi:HNH endonuclease
MTCLYCGGDKKLANEHMVPRSRGGLDIPENIFRACQRCNSSKGDRLPSEWRADLPTNIRQLERIALSFHPKLLPRKKNRKAQKQQVINVRCTGPQKIMLEKIAASRGMGVSTWLLYQGLVDAEQRQEKARQ